MCVFLVLLEFSFQFVLLQKSFLWMVFLMSWHQLCHIINYIGSDNNVKLVLPLLCVVCKNVLYLYAVVYARMCGDYLMGATTVEMRHKYI